MSKIRNIEQSFQLRDVIKQAPDIVVYIDGQDYLINPYLSVKGETISFNDFVNSWQSSYDLESMVPSGSLSLVVPVQFDHLFRAPGGNNILKTMSEIRVYCKGYYLSPNGNTIYHQIFRGYISSISYAQTGKMTNISISCSGALGILERMQVDMNPSLMSSAPTEVTYYTSTNWNLDPYQQIAWVFLYGSMIDGFEVYSLKQAVMDKTNVYYEAIEKEYVAKWQAILYDLARDVHIFGCPDVNDIIAAIQNNIKPTDNSHDTYRKDLMGVARDFTGKESEEQQITGRQGYYDQIRQYLPDMGFASVQLLNGRLTSRLERLRYIANLITFEAYQDVDGSIIVKPPLYNLDVMNLDNGEASGYNTVDPSLYTITDSTNPFVVNLDEIISDSETEDEAGIRLTRVTARGSYLPSFQFDGPKEFLATAEDIDVQKLSQFGLRTEPPREAHWFQDGDDKSIYAFAVSEMARANRAFRTYSVTIPIRPELKLGFPMYIPHKDIYGYIRTITMNYTRGSSATTTVTLDSLRRRPMLPEDQPITGADGKPATVRMMTPQPDLVLRWSKVADKTVTADTAAAAALTNNLASLPFAGTIGAQEQQMIAARQAGASYNINSDGPEHCWRIQPDENEVFSGKNTNRKLDKDYYSDLRSVRPYTDEKGYELVGPFPLGRWKSLKEALTLFTIKNALGDTPTQSAGLNAAIKPVSSETAVLTNADAFLFTADGDVSQNTAEDMISTLQVQANTTVTQYKSFELSYTTGDSSSPASPIGPTLGASAPPQPELADSDTATQNRADTLLSGTPTSKGYFESITDSIPITDEG